MGKIDNERAMKLYRDGASDSELATILGVSVSAVGQWRGKTGLKRNAAKRNAAKRAEESLPQPAAPAAPSSEGGGVSLPQSASPTAPSSEGALEAEATEEEEENEEMKETEKKPELVERILAYVERGMRQVEEAKREVDRAGDMQVLSGKYRALSDLRDEINLLRVLEASEL